MISQLNEKYGVEFICENGYGDQLVAEVLLDDYAAWLELIAIKQKENIDLIQAQKRAFVADDLNAPSILPRSSYYSKIPILVSNNAAISPTYDVYMDYYVPNYVDNVRNIKSWSTNQWTTWTQNSTKVEYMNNHQRAGVTVYGVKFFINATDPFHTSMASSAYALFTYAF